MMKRGLVAVALLVAIVAVGSGTAAGGGERVKEVEVTVATTFKIDPERDFEQYHGDLDYTKVVATDPKDADFPSTLAKKARLKCEDLFVNGGNGLYPAFRIFYKEDGEFVQMNVSKFPDEFQVIEDLGKWISRGGNGHFEGQTIYAKGAFWDPDYNFRKNFVNTSFNFDGHTVHARCDANIVVKKPYPAT